MAIGEEAVVTNAMKAVRQGVEQEAADELVGAPGHDLRLAVVAMVLPAERDFILGHGHQARIGDGDAMGVATEIGQHLFGPAERRLRIDHPFDAPQVAEATSEAGRFGEVGEIAAEAELAGVEGGASRNSRRNSRERTRTGRKKPGRQAIQRAPSGDGPPPGTTQWICG